MRYSPRNLYHYAAREFRLFPPMLARAECDHPVEVAEGCSVATCSTLTSCRSTTASPGSKATFPSLPCFPLVYLYFAAPELCISRPLLTCGTVCAQLVESLAHVLSIAHALATAHAVTSAAPPAPEKSRAPPMRPRRPLPLGDGAARRLRLPAALWQVI